MKRPPLHPALLAAYILPVLVGIYAVWVEPYWLDVTYHRIPAPIAKPLRLAHLSDLHTRGFRRRERGVVARLAEEKPDAVLITGDSIIDVSTYARVAETLRELHAPLGVWFVRGNWENALRVGSTRAWGAAAKDEGQYYRENGVKLLNNRGARLRDDVWLFGLDEMVYGEPSLEQALKDAPKGVYRIALFHAPDYFDRVAGHAELSLAGHCHGGQIRLPFLRPLYLPPGCHEYFAGWYERNGSRLYVTRGIGNSILDMRLFARPELAIFDLVPGPAAH